MIPILLQQEQNGCNILGYQMAIGWCYILVSSLSKLGVLDAATNLSDLLYSCPRSQCPWGSVLPLSDFPVTHLYLASGDVYMVSSCIISVSSDSFPFI